MTQISHGRRFFTCLELGLKHERLGSTNFGLCASDTMEGDKIAMFLGSSTLYIIRDIGTDANGRRLYGWVGQAYVHNWIQGQLVDMNLDRTSGMLDAHPIALI